MLGICEWAVFREEVIVLRSGGYYLAIYGDMLLCSA